MNEAFRGLKPEEREMVLRLVGDRFAHRNIVVDQLNAAEISSIDGCCIFEFKVNASVHIPVLDSLLGEGTFTDLDGTPVVISLLQKNGLLWRLDVTKLDSKPILQFPGIDKIRYLGFGQGISFEE